MITLDSFLSAGVPNWDAQNIPKPEIINKIYIFSSSSLYKERRSSDTAAFLAQAAATQTVRHCWPDTGRNPNLFLLS